MTRRELRERERAAELQIAESPVVVPHQTSSTDYHIAEVRRADAKRADTMRGEKKFRGAKAARKLRSGKAAGQLNPGQRNPSRTHEPAIVQAASISAASRVKPHASHKKPFKRRMLSKLISVSAMAGAALMIVSTSVPANAFFPTEASMPLTVTATVPTTKEAQSVVSAPVAAEASMVVRDGYTASSLREQIFLRYGNRNYAYTPNPNGTIRWPFPVAVPISDGFGYRVSPCRGCSSDHQGLDMTAGNGAPIGVIADGVVVGVNSEDWSYGQHVIVEHMINGARIQSWYAHMTTGSIRVQLGQVLKVGDEIGLVGSTGASTGSHLHLEIHVNGVAVDPFAWLLANAY